MKERKPTYRESVLQQLMQKDYLSKKELMTYLSCCEPTARKVGRESGALRKMGKRNLYCRADINRYIESKKAAV